jgi:glycosyltransferase involved in cell wall biosynthesis
MVESGLPIALGLLQDEFEFSGEFQVFRGWQEKLQRSGYRLIVFGPKGHLLRASGYRLHSQGEFPLKKWIEQWAFILEAVACAKEASIVHLFLPTPSFLWIGDWVKRASQRPVVITCLAEKADLSGFEWRRHVRQAPRFHIIRRIAADVFSEGRFRADRYCVGSQSLTRQLTQAGCPADRLVKMHATLPMEPEPDDRSREAATWMGVSPTFLYIGHFLPTKGIEPLLEALALMPAQVRLLLAWSGLGDRPAVETQIQKLGLAGRVRIADHPIHRTLIFAQALGLVAPFPVSYGQVSPPVVVLEALRAGVPLVVPPLASLDGLLDDQRTALFIDPYDPLSIAKAMQQLLAQPDFVRLMRDAQRAKFSKLEKLSDPELLYQPLRWQISHG